MVAPSEANAKAFELAVPTYPQTLQLPGGALATHSYREFEGDDWKVDNAELAHSPSTGYLVNVTTSSEGVRVDTTRFSGNADERPSVDAYDVERWNFAVDPHSLTHERATHRPTLAVELQLPGDLRHTGTVIARVPGAKHPNYRTSLPGSVVRQGEQAQFEVSPVRLTSQRPTLTAGVHGEEGAETAHVTRIFATPAEIQHFMTAVGGQIGLSVVDAAELVSLVQEQVGDLITAHEIFRVSQRHLGELAVLALQRPSRREAALLGLVAIFGRLIKEQ